MMLTRPTKDNAPGQGGVDALFDEHSNSPQFSFPRPSSVKGRVLADLLLGIHLTHLDVWERHGSSRAAHHILKLREAGWPILTHEIATRTSDGRTAHIASYSLPKAYVDAAGEIGRGFVREVRGRAK